MISEICYITMYEEHIEHAKQIFAQCGYPVKVIYTKIDQIHENVRKQMQEGVRVMIARGGVPDLIKQVHTLPIVDLQYDFLDFLEPIEKAYEMSDKVALLGWYKNRKNFDKYRSKLRENLTIVEFGKTTASDCEEYIESEVKKVLRQGIQVVVGGGGVARAAKRLGVPFVHVDIDREAYIDAVEKAQYHLRIYQEQEHRYKMVQAVLNGVSEGVLAVGQDQQIIQCNPVARQLLKLQNIGEKYPPLEKVLPDEKTLQLLREGRKITNHVVSCPGGNLMLNSEFIQVDEVPVGAVLILHETDHIRDMEKRIQKNLIQSGYYAKHSFDDIGGDSAAMAQTKKKAELYAKTNSTVLIFGETGTGKELFAQSIHNSSARRNDPFVAINCAAIPESLLESELFGYVKGAFTGARADGRAGYFELAHKGTLFMDEIGEISLKVQSRLLRVLQEKEVTRVGDDRVISVDVRIIAATNRDLKQEVEKGRFRKDLYYRLCVLTLSLPPLRNRRADILPILRILLRQNGLDSAEFTPEARRLLETQEWPGNVRELDNFAERICAISNETVIDEVLVSNALDLQDDILAPQTQETEREHLLAVLRRNFGNKRKTAAELGISTTTLWRRLKDIEPEQE